MQHRGGTESIGVQPIPLSIEYLRGLVKAVDSIHPDDVDGEDVVVALGQVRSLLNWAGAREMVLVAGLTRKPVMSPPVPTPTGPPRQVVIESGVEVAVGEVAALQCISVLSARRRVEQAVQVTRNLPGTLAAMTSGLLDGYRAKIVVEELLEAATDSGQSVVPPEVRAEIEAVVMPRAHELTPSQLRCRLRREIARRCTGKRTARPRAALRPKVEVGPLPGGLGYLYAVLPADAAALAEITLESMARVLDAATRPTTPTAAATTADPQAAGASPTAASTTRTIRASRTVRASRRKIRAGRMTGRTRNGWWPGGYHHYCPPDTAAPRTST